MILASESALFFCAKKYAGKKSNTRKIIFRENINRRERGLSHKTYMAEIRMVFMHNIGNINLVNINIDLCFFAVWKSSIPTDSRIFRFEYFISPAIKHEEIKLCNTDSLSHEIFIIPVAIRCKCIRYKESKFRLDTHRFNSRIPATVLIDDDLRNIIRSGIGISVRRILQNASVEIAEIPFPEHRTGRLIREINVRNKNRNGRMIRGKSCNW